MGDKIFVTIPLERYEQLTRAEHDANHLKALIDNIFNSYRTLERKEVELLHQFYIGKEEVTK